MFQNGMKTLVLVISPMCTLFLVIALESKYRRIFRMQSCNICYNFVYNFSLEAAHLLQRIDKSYFPNEWYTKSLRICTFVLKN